MKAHRSPPRQAFTSSKIQSKRVHENVANLAVVESSKERDKPHWTRNVYFILCGSLLGILFIAAIVLPIVIITALNTASTSTTAAVLPSVTTNAPSINATNPVTATTAGSMNTTTACPNMACTFVSETFAMTTTYGGERVRLNCSQSLSNMTMSIVVKRTVNATYANQYQTFWNLTTYQTYSQTLTDIIYTWTIVPGQIIQGIGFPHFVEGQFVLPNANQSTNFDTYSVRLTSVCGFTVSTNGTF